MAVTDPSRARFMAVAHAVRDTLHHTYGVVLSPLPVHDSEPHAYYRFMIWLFSSPEHSGSSRLVGMWESEMRGDGPSLWEWKYAAGCFDEDRAAALAAESQLTGGLEFLEAEAAEHACPETRYREMYFMLYEFCTTGRKSRDRAVL